MGARQKVLAWFLLLVFHGRNETGAAPSQQFQSRKQQEQLSWLITEINHSFQQEQPPTFQTQAGFPDVLNSQQQPFYYHGFLTYRRNLFKHHFSQQQLPFQVPQN